MSGVGDYTYFLADALANLGCEVEVLTTVGESEPTLYPEHSRVRVHRVIGSWGLAGLPHLIRGIGKLRSNTLFLQYAPHAFNRRGITLGVNLLPALIRAGAGKRIVVNFHELYIPFDLSLKRTLGALWQRAMAVLTAASSNCLTANSREWEKHLKQLGIRKAVRVIPVGSNIPRTRTTSAELGRIRSRLLGREDALLVGCFGSTGPHRDANLLRDALRRAANRHPLQAVWLGDSGVRETDPEGGAITWTGVLPHPEISRIMSACDMFVLPFTDGVSTKRGTLAAGLMHGLPIVTTRGRRVDPIFQHGDNVFLVSAANSEALAEGILQVAGSTQLRARLRQGAKVLHQQYFAWEVIAKEVVSALAD